MYEKIIEIIIYVISELKLNNDIESLNLDLLLSKGYTDSEISTALSWIVDRIDLTEQIFTFNGQSEPASFRILHDLEKDLFTTEAWGELVNLSSLGLVSNEQVELMIDRAFMLGLKQIDLEQLKMFIANVVFNAEFSKLGGSRFMLDGKDTIN